MVVGLKPARKLVELPPMPIATALRFYSTVTSSKRKKVVLLFTLWSTLSASTQHVRKADVADPPLEEYCIFFEADGRQSAEGGLYAWTP